MTDETGKDAINYQVTDTAIQDLKKKYAKRLSPLTEDGYALCISGAKEIRSIEIKVEAKRKELNGEAQTHIKTVNSEAKRITALLVEIRTPMVDDRKMVDDAKEKAKRDEINRKEDIQKKLDTITLMVGECVGGNEFKLKGTIEKLEKIDTSEGFDEFASLAIEKKDEALKGLNEMLTLLEANKEQEKKISNLEKQVSTTNVEPEQPKKEPVKEYGSPGLSNNAAVVSSATPALPKKESLPEPTLPKKESLPEPTLTRTGQTPPLMKRMFKTDSSNVSLIGYNNSEKILAVTFSSGKSYYYYEFSPDDFAAFCDADSIGRHFAAYVKGSFSFKPV